MRRPMLVLTFSVAIFDEHTSLTYLQTGTSLLATFGAAGVDLVHPTQGTARGGPDKHCGGKLRVPDFFWPYDMIEIY